MITEKNFGKTLDMKEVILYSLKNEDGMQADVMNYGAILVNLFVPNKAGEVADVVLGYDRVKDYFVNGVLQIPDVKVNGLTGRDSAPHVVSLSVRGVRSEVLLHALEEKGIYVSAGSACASNKPSVSATLKAIGVDKDLLDSTIRFSFSTFTTKEEIDYTLQNLYDIIPMLRKYTRH